MAATRQRNVRSVTDSGPSRRGFLSCHGLSPGLAGLAGAGLIGALQAPLALADLTPLNSAERRRRAFAISRDAALFQSDLPEILGEAVALSVLRDTATIYHEQFPGFSLTRYDGTPVTICPSC